MEKLVIKKTDSTSKAALSGAEFELREKESGKVVEKLVTDKTGTATSGKIPIATYKNGKVEKTVEYILVETKAPNGYELSSKKEEIRFEYKDGKTKVIEIVKEIKNTKSPSGSTPTGNNPKTGDSTNIWLPILLAVLSACGIGGVIWYKKKKEIKEYGSGLLDLPAALFPGRIIGGLYETHKRNHDRGSLPDGTQLLPYVPVLAFTLCTGKVCRNMKTCVHTSRKQMRMTTQKEQTEAMGNRPWLILEH